MSAMAADADPAAPRRLLRPRDGDRAQDGHRERDHDDRASRDAGVCGNRDVADERFRQDHPGRVSEDPQVRTERPDEEDDADRRPVADDPIVTSSGGRSTPRESAARSRARRRSRSGRSPAIGTTHGRRLPRGRETGFRGSAWRHRCPSARSARNTAADTYSPRRMTPAPLTRIGSATTAPTSAIVASAWPCESRQPSTGRTASAGRHRARAAKASRIHSACSGLNTSRARTRTPATVTSNPPVARIARITITSTIASATRPCARCASMPASRLGQSPTSRAQPAGTRRSRRRFRRRRSSSRCRRSLPESRRRRWKRSNGGPEEGRPTATTRWL